MNACILFVLLNGSMWATDGCWTYGGQMLSPQDVVYTQRLPQLYTIQVFTPPPHLANSWRPYARSWRNWDGYRYNPRHGRRWIRHRRWLRQRGQRRWMNGYRQGRRDARARMHRRGTNKKFRKHKRRMKRNKRNKR